MSCLCLAWTFQYQVYPIIIIVRMVSVFDIQGPDAPECVQHIRTEPGTLVQ